MVIVVTGAIGIGKTTVCRNFVKIAQNQGYACGGILSYKDADESITLEDIESGKKKALASITNLWHGPRTAKYFFNPKAIDFGVQVIDGAISKDILVVDEIGHLELRGEGFAKVIELIRAGKVKNSILVIRKELLLAFSARLDSKLSIIETTIENRNELPQKIGTLLNLRKRT